MHKRQLSCFAVIYAVQGIQDISGVAFFLAEVDELFSEVRQIGSFEWPLISGVSWQIDKEDCLSKISPGKFRVTEGLTIPHIFHDAVMSTPVKFDEVGSWYYNPQIVLVE